MVSNLTRDELMALPYETYMATRHKRLNQNPVAISTFKGHPEIIFAMEAIWTKAYYLHQINEK